MTHVPGSIIAQQAYAQGKMLDNSGWSGRLPRGITPSDVDWAFDNGGLILFGEFSSKSYCWNDISHGQRCLYENLVRRTGHVAVLLKHSVPTNCQINTLCDVEAFDAMLWLDGVLRTTGPKKGARWPDVVDKWAESPRSAHGWLVRSITPEAN